VRLLVHADFAVAGAEFLDELLVLLGELPAGARLRRELDAILLLPRSRPCVLL